MSFLISFSTSTTNGSQIKVIHPTDDRAESPRQKAIRNKQAAEVAGV